MIKAMIGLSLAALMTGCAEYQAMIAQYGAEGADNALTASEWANCKQATAGALERKYQLYSNPNGPRATAWRELCYGADEVIADE
jgi:hypothetical protein